MGMELHYTVMKIATGNAATATAAADLTKVAVELILLQKIARSIPWPSLTFLIESAWVALANADPNALANFLLYIDQLIETNKDVEIKEVREL